MRTIEIELYKFAELSEEAQQKTIQELWDINVDYDWWSMAYDSISDSGVTIHGFDLGRAQTIEMRMNNSHLEVANYIISNWGHECEGWKESNVFATAYENAEEDSDEMETLEGDFHHVLETVFFHQLEQEYEWRQEEEQVKESITANEYEFLKEGGKIQ